VLDILPLFVGLFHT